MLQQSFKVPQSRLPPTNRNNIDPLSLFTLPRQAPSSEAGYARLLPTTLLKPSSLTGSRRASFTPFELLSFPFVSRFRSVNDVFRLFRRQKSASVSWSPYLGNTAWRSRAARINRTSESTNVGRCMHRLELHLRS